MSPRVWWSGLTSTAGATRRTSVGVPSDLPLQGLDRLRRPEGRGDDRDQAALGHLRSLTSLLVHSFSSGGIASSGSPYSSGSCGSSGWAMPSGKRCSSPCSAMSSRSFSASSKPSASPSPASTSGSSAGSSVSGSRTAADRGGFLRGLRLFLLDEFLVALLGCCGHETAPVSEACSVELFGLVGAGRRRWSGRAGATGSKGSSPPERPISQPTIPPSAAPSASRVTERNGLRVNFEAAPWAVCFAVVLTAFGRVWF